MPQMTCCNHCQNCKDTIVEILLKPSNSYGTLSGTKKKNKKKKRRILGKKKRIWKPHTVQFQNLLQSNSKQDSVVPS